MRIGTISFHASFNYGSMLQAWALQTYLEKEGHQVEIINYRSWYQKAHYAKPFDVSSPFSMMASLKRLFLAPSSFPHLYSKWNLFNDFLNQHLHITKEYHTFHQLKKANFNYDLVITGSDQIWINTLEAGKPYIIKWRKANSNIVNPTFGGVTIKNEVHPVEQTAIDFVGSFSPVIIEGEDRTKLYLGDDNTLYYPSTDMTINACRAYFQLHGLTVGDISSEVNTFVLNFGDDDENASGIVDIDHSPLTIDHEVDAWYTIDGRKLSGKPTQKGIYIHNGKKIVIK